LSRGEDPKVSPRVLAIKAVSRDAKDQNFERLDQAHLTGLIAAAAI